MSKDAKHTPNELWPRGWDYYYIPRSSLNPHGTYAIIDWREGNIDKSVRSHIAEVTGFGDGSPSKRKPPEQVHMMVSAPDFYRAAMLRREYEALPVDRGGKNGPKGRARTAWIEAEEAAVAKAEGRS